MNDYVRDRMMTNEESEACARTLHQDCVGCKGCYCHNIDKLTLQLEDIEEMLIERLNADSKISG